MTPLSQKPSDLGVGESVDGALLRLDGVHQHPRAERHLNILRYSFEMMQLGGWAIYLTSVLSSTTPDSIIYSKDYRSWGRIKVISAILSGFQPILTRF